MVEQWRLDMAASSSSDRADVLIVDVPEIRVLDNPYTCTYTQD